jgi:diguanylate cyclase (GGDEF)-like protein
MVLHADVFTGYLICGASAALGGTTLRLVEATDDGARGALRDCGLGFWILGMGLLPAGLGPLASHPLMQWVLGVSALLGMLFVGSGLGSLHGRRLAPQGLLMLSLLMVLPLTVAVNHDAMTYGRLFPYMLLLASVVMVWQGRDYLLRPRGLAEQLVALNCAALLVTSLARLVTTMAYVGPVRPDLMYVPEPWSTLYAVLYGVMPMYVACLLLVIVNGRLQQKLRARAAVDELTGMLNRRAVREQATELLDRQRRSRAMTAVLMLDLDRFKLVNDVHGHAAGDAVLRLASQALKTSLRQDDTLLSRYGGEEFVALVPVDDPDVARRVAERLREAVAAVDWHGELRLTPGVTVSVGMALVSGDEDLDQALLRADEALYRAKRDGRNQCQVALDAA